ncbi:restriction endonuclease subunit S [Pararhodobacter sp.]|uniref:restriction endonuclease subunit S n=1 Tax=Pararhodobacter sp. TaxID=2127056 RepID=UPI002B0005E1|nr:restriction endonuclease subunit S [Pararhodobacter sp.]
MIPAAPKLRFPEFKDPWKPGHAGDAFMNSRAKGAAGLPIYSVTMDRGLVRRDSMDRQMAADAADNQNLRAQRGDVVYNMMRMWQGAVGLAHEECMVSPAYVVLSPRESTSPQFFDQWFKAKRMLHLLGAYSHGITSDRLRLYADDFARIPLHMPTLPEQQKIAAFLRMVDAKLVQLTAKRAALARFKAGLMQKLFSQQLRFTRDDGKAFPEWDVRDLGDIASRSAKKNKDLSHTRVLTNSAVHGVIDQRDFFDKDIANSENLDGYYIVKKGDFVYNPRISVSAPVGPIKRNDLGDGVMSPLYTVFRFHDENTDFFAQYFQTSLWHDYMKSVANYGARHDRMAITIVDLMALPLPFPHPDEQQKIANAISAMDSKIRAVVGQVTKLEAFKKGLLQQMFV